MFHFTAALPLSLYIHIPWCLQKCPYCDFNSHAAPKALPEMAYVDALIADLSRDLPDVWGRSLESIFIGGGTPSLFSPEALDRLLSQVRALLNPRSGMEVTMEANPGTFEQAKFAEFHDLGINRLSIGVQSFNDQMLQKLGRVHDGREALRAAEIAYKAGFENVNLDLMFGLPGQTEQMALADVQQALSLQPQHLSYYQLTLEPNTAFAARPPTLPPDERIWNMQERGIETLQTAGYGGYEVSAYAQEGRQCAHNLNYWQFGDYLGIGAGAHGKLTLPGEDRVLRRWKQRQPAQYMADHAAGFVSGEENLERKKIGLEFMMNALRLNEGVASALFLERTGLPLSIIAEPLQQAVDKGLLHWDHREIKATELGRRFLNDLLGMFL
ncbi:MAG: radical SAM family heme chaperone HemW [Gammaproteobacteria bacterium]|nr:radical SAM family heme chaperone HemW [Gammaproteobacteria bacterium]